MTQISDRQSSLTNIYVVAENRLLRESLVRLFKKRGDLSVVGQASYSESTPEQIAAARQNFFCWTASTQIISPTT